jgi:DNA-binding GntR family transcriptional regulator
MIAIRAALAEAAFGFHVDGQTALVPIELPEERRVSAKLGSRWTAKFRSMIYDHHERYRRMAHLVAKRSDEVRREYVAICEAALARDAETAARISAEHIRRTGRALQQQLTLPAT